MGFMDKAKQQAKGLAEQAQAKLDEQQGRFNERAAAMPSDAPITEYDQHGRPVATTPSAAPPSPAAPSPTPAPPVPPAAGGPAPASRPDDAPPALSSGDPLAG